MDGCRAGVGWGWWGRGGGRLKDERRQNVARPKQQLNHPVRPSVRPSWSFLRGSWSAAKKPSHFFICTQFRRQFFFFHVHLCVCLLFWSGLPASSAPAPALSLPALSSRGSAPPLDPPSLPLPLSSCLSCHRLGFFTAL